MVKCQEADVHIEGSLQSESRPTEELVFGIGGGERVGEEDKAEKVDGRVLFWE
jgi:hypothetical protein